MSLRFTRWRVAQAIENVTCSGDPISRWSGYRDRALGRPEGDVRPMVGAGEVHLLQTLVRLLAGTQEVGTGAHNRQHPPAGRDYGAVIAPARAGMQHARSFGPGDH